jgi:hypothetical protein
MNKALVIALKMFLLVFLGKRVLNVEIRTN